MTEAECLDDALTALLQSLSVYESLGERFVSIPDLDGFWRAYDGALNDLAISRAWRHVQRTRGHTTGESRAWANPRPGDMPEPSKDYLAGGVIHHIDGNPLNNAPDNCIVVYPKKAKP